MNQMHWLYFGLGILSTVPFTLRFIIQWLLSEKKKLSHVTPIFWHLSIIGNLFLLLHYLIQVQYHLYFLRFFTTYFAFRQLRFFNGKAKPFSWARFFKANLLIGFSLTALFVLRVFLQYDDFSWIHIPQMPWATSEKQITNFWHLLGFMGAALFVSRLWVQWWQSEKSQKSYLSPMFWWLSIFGGSLTLIYAFYISDIVTMLSYGTGLIPYVRNLILIKNQSLKEAGQ